MIQSNGVRRNALKPRLIGLVLVVVMHATVNPVAAQTSAQSPPSALPSVMARPEVVPTRVALIDKAQNKGQGRVSLALFDDTFIFRLPIASVSVNVAFQAQDKPDARTKKIAAAELKRGDGQKRTSFTWSDEEFGSNFTGSDTVSIGKFQMFVNGFTVDGRPVDAGTTLDLSPVQPGAWGTVTVRTGDAVPITIFLDLFSHDKPKFEPFYTLYIGTIYDARKLLRWIKQPWDGPSRNPFEWELREGRTRAALNRIADSPEAARTVWLGEVAKLDAATDQELFDWMLAASAEDYHKARTPAAKARAVLLLSIDGPFVAPAYVWKDGKTTRYAVTLENEAKVRLAGFDEKGRFVMGGWADLDADAPEKDRWAALGDLLGVDFAHPVPAPRSTTAPATAPTTAPTTASATSPTTAPTTAPTTGSAFAPTTGPATRAAVATPRPATAGVATPATMRAEAR